MLPSFQCHFCRATDAQKVGTRLSVRTSHFLGPVLGLALGRFVMAPLILMEEEALLLPPPNDVPLCAENVPLYVLLRRESSLLQE